MWKNSGRIVPLSERQQMALLKKIEENRTQATSPKPDQQQVLIYFNFTTSEFSWKWQTNWIQEKFLIFDLKII